MARTFEEGDHIMRRSEKGRIGIGMALVCVLCFAVFVFGTEAVWGSESVDATTSVPPSRVIERAVPGSCQKLITQERVEMLVEKDFWTHRLEGPRLHAGDLWIVEAGGCVFIKRAVVH